MTNPAEVLRRNAATAGHKAALRFEGRTQTHAELYDRAKRLANALRTHGVDAGDRVAVAADNCFETLEMLAGLTLAAMCAARCTPTTARSGIAISSSSPNPQRSFCRTSTSTHWHQYSGTVRPSAPWWFSAPMWCPRPTTTRHC